MGTACEPISLSLLLEPMRTILILSLSICTAVHGQVEFDAPIRATGPDGERGIIGLADPVSGTAGITVNVASSGQLHWATATAQTDTLTLDVIPAVDAYREGLLLRFNAVGSDQVKGWLRVGALPSLPVIRNDGQPIDPAPLGLGSVAEILYHEETWILLNANYSSCPSGSVAVNDRLCIEAVAFPGLKIYQSIERCGNRGGKLCTWDEYVAACTLIGPQLSGLFDEWEWIDDTSNHTHTADQVGRYTCQSQRAANAITLIVGDTRCCYHPR